MNSAFIRFSWNKNEVIKYCINGYDIKYYFKS